MFGNLLSVFSDFHQLIFGCLHVDCKCHRWKGKNKETCVRSKKGEDDGARSPGMRHLIEVGNPLPGLSMNSTELCAPQSSRQ